MKHAHRIDPDADVLLAGQTAPAGVYEQIGRRRTIRLETEGVLPAACDGQATAYIRRRPTWGELTSQRGRGQDATRGGRPAASSRRSEMIAR